jgi:hypothetical protein
VGTNEDEQQRLDRIEGYIKQMAEVSEQLQRELDLARRLAAQRRRADQPHASAKSRPRRPGKRR